MTSLGLLVELRTLLKAMTVRILDKKPKTCVCIDNMSIIGYVLKYSNNKLLNFNCYTMCYLFTELLYSWFKDGDTLNNIISPDSKPYTFVSSDGTLHFSSVTKDDRGDYQCTVVPPFGELSGGGKTSQPIELIISEGSKSSCRHCL